MKTNDKTCPSRVDGKQLPVSSRWHDMHKRCYSKEFQQKQKTYVGCSVCQGWMEYSNFYKWYQLNYIEGYHLDKDLLVYENKVYSPGTCLFVSREINNLTNVKPPGKYKRGVYKHGSGFRSQISKHGEVHCLGTFPTELEAHEAWKAEKILYTQTFIDLEERPTLIQALKDYQQRLRDGVYS